MYLRASVLMSTWKYPGQNFAVISSITAITFATTSSGPLEVVPLEQPLESTPGMEQGQTKAEQGPSTPQVLELKWTVYWQPISLLTAYIVPGIYSIFINFDNYRAYALCMYHSIHLIQWIIWTIRRLCPIISIFCVYLTLTVSLVLLSDKDRSPVHKHTDTLNNAVMRFLLYFGTEKSFACYYIVAP